MDFCMVCSRCTGLRIQGPMPATGEAVGQCCKLENVACHCAATAPSSVDRACICLVIDVCTILISFTHHSSIASTGCPTSDVLQYPQTRVSGRPLTAHPWSGRPPSEVLSAVNPVVDDVPIQKKGSHTSLQCPAGVECHAQDQLACNQ